MSKNILVVVAHPDDEILGFGATGAKLVKEGWKVQPVILCGNVDVRHKRLLCHCPTVPQLLRCRQLRYLLPRPESLSRAVQYAPALRRWPQAAACWRVD